MHITSRLRELASLGFQWLHVITTDRYYLLSCISQKERSKVCEQTENEASNEKMLLLHRARKLCIDPAR